MQTVNKRASMRTELLAAPIAAGKTITPLPEVLLNGRFLNQRVTGVQRYARETLLGLDQLLADGAGDFARWTLLVPAGVQAPPLQRIRVEPLGRLQGHAWEQTELGWRARKGLLFSFAFSGPVWLKHQVVTVHDAAVFRMPGAYHWRFRLWYRTMVSRIVRRAPRTVAVSRFSAGEAQACFGAPAARLRVATEGWQHLERVVADDSVLDRHGLRGRPFALAVSSPTPNKNSAAIAKALALLGADAPCVALAGSSDPAVFRAAAGAAAGVVQMGFVSDGELKALYQHAHCFVMPSFYEGFGIPPLEAMACGCPVIASTADALREVCGDAALYFDPHQPAELAQQLRRLFADAALAKDMSQRSLVRASAYSWAESARLNLAVVREALRTGDTPC